MAKKTHHIVPDPDGGWNVKRGGATRASKHFDKKQDAINWGRQISRKQDSEFVVHRKDGTVEHKGSHRGNPLPSRGKTR